VKKILASTTAAVALLTTSLVAQAADLPQKAYAPPPVMMAVYDWTGFYIGGNAGYGSNRNCWGRVPVAGAVIPTSSSGGVVGGQAGYRWQMGQGCVRFGSPGRLGVASRLANQHFWPDAYDRAKVAGFGLFTGQIGYAWNAALLYLKGGAAVTSNRYDITTTLGGVGVASASSTRWGGTVGAGFEYGFAPNWSAGIEYDHLFMGDSNNSFSVPNPLLAGALNRISQDIDMVTVRVNYRFGGLGVARYWFPSSL
jgi:outer membrane immunogenic protein